MSDTSWDHVIREATPREQHDFATRALMILTFEDAVESLFASGFIRPWFADQVRKHLVGGGVIEFKKEGELMATYRWAQDGEVAKLAANGIRETSMQTAARRRVKQTWFTFKFPEEFAEREKIALSLTKQSSLMLRAVMESGATRANMDQLDVMLEPIRDQLGGEKRDLAGLFRHHTKTKYATLGVVSMEEDEDEDDDSSEEVA